MQRVYARQIELSAVERGQERERERESEMR